MVRCPLSVIRCPLSVAAFRTTDNGQRTTDHGQRLSRLSHNAPAMQSLVPYFPAWNASLNALSGILLFIAWRFVKNRNITRHKQFMLAACTSSVLFLISYVTYHALRGGVVTKFQGTGAMRTLYFVILTSHTILAVVILPLAILSVFNGLKNRIPQHRRVARWTFPLWMYVSVTGVLVYFFLYQWFPSHG